MYPERFEGLFVTRTDRMYFCILGDSLVFFFVSLGTVWRAFSILGNCLEVFVFPLRRFGGLFVYRTVWRSFYPWRLFTGFYVSFETVWRSLCILGECLEVFLYPGRFGGLFISQTNVFRLIKECFCIHNDRKKISLYPSR